jgi:hypothetical protein
MCPLTGDLALELSGGREHVHDQPAHAGCRVERLDDRNEGPDAARAVRAGLRIGIVERHSHPMHRVNRARRAFASMSISSIGYAEMKVYDVKH